MILVIFLGFILGWVGEVRAGCVGVEWGADESGRGLCVESECHVFKRGRASIMCNGESKTMDGYCGGTCSVGEDCDLKAYSCNFCGSCGNEAWCGACGGGIRDGRAGMSAPVNVWVRVLERGNDGKTVAWKGSSEDNNDPVWVPNYFDRWEGTNSKSLLPRWSVDPELGGGIDNEGNYLKYWPAFGGSSDESNWKTWDKDRNKISDGMNVVVDQLIAPFDDEGRFNSKVSAREYWANHFCTGGVVGGMSNGGKWPLYNGENNLDLQTCTRWEEDCSSGTCRRWCRGDVDGCWSNWKTNGDSYDYYYQLDAIRKFAEGQNDTAWMDLRYDGYWSLSYASESLRLDGGSHEIKLIPPEGKVCKDVRWFKGGKKPVEAQIESGKMEFGRDDQGVCSLGDFEYSKDGNLIIFEVESAQEAPKLEVGTNCSEDGKEMTLVVKPQVGTRQISVMGNRGGNSDPWVPGNNSVGGRDFLMSDLEVVGGVNKVINVNVDAGVPYAISIMPCGAGEQFPCKGKLLSFSATCPVADDPKWRITARAMCVDSNSGDVREPVYFSGSATKYSVSVGDEIVRSKLGNSWFYTFGVDGKSGVDYMMKFESGRSLDPLRIISSNGLNTPIRSKDEYLWNSLTMNSGTYVIDYEAPRNWCVEKKTWNLIPRVNCGEGNLAYLPVDFGYSLENGQSTVQGYTNCPKYQVIKSRGFGADLDASVRVEGAEYNLVWSKLIKCTSLTDCGGNSVNLEAVVKNSSVKLENNMISGNYEVWFDVPSELRPRVCGPKLVAGLDKSCSVMSAYPVTLDSDVEK